MKKRLYRARTILTALVISGSCSISTLAHAEQLDFSSSLNPVGSGARAMGMGGAFIGVADDATAASWNPAGLVQLEKPEVSIVYSYFNHHQDYHPSNFPLIRGGDTSDSHDVNYASAAYPFTAFDRNVIVSLNYQHLYDLTKKNNFTQNLSGFSVGQRSFSQTGKLYALSPAMAIQVTAGVYIGGTANIWESWLGNNGWDYHDSFTGQTTNILDNKSSSRGEFSGLNGNIGFLWNITSMLTLGGVYKTPFDADLRVVTDMSLRGTALPSIHRDYTLTMPASYGLGLACRLNDSLTFSADVYRTEWSEFVLKDKGSGLTFNPVYGDEISNGRLKDTTQVRLGAEYLFIDPSRVIPVRGGLFYDPVPQRGYVDDYWGIAVGTGFSHPRFSVDVAYQYRFGSNVNGNIGLIQEKSVDVQQHTFLASLIWYF